MVRDTIRIVYAAALLGVLLAGGTAVAEQSERPAVIAEGEIASAGASGNFSHRPGVEGTFRPVERAADAAPIPAVEAGRRTGMGIYRPGAADRPHHA